MKARLPDGWKWTTLGELGTFLSGGTPSKKNPAYWGGDIPFVTGADITIFRISDGRAHLTHEGAYSGKTALCHPGTVLLVTRTRVGRVGVADRLLAASQDLTPFICGDQVLPEYMVWYLLSLSSYLEENTRGSTIRGLTRDFVSEIAVPVPPLDEQRRIVARLEALLAEIEKAEAEIEAAAEKTRRLWESTLWEAFAEANETKRVRLGDVCQTKTETRDPRQTPDTPFKYVDITSVNNQAKVIENWRELQGRDAPSRARKVIRSGDVIVATTRPYLNAVVYVPPELDGEICSTGFCVLRAVGEVEPCFLFAFVQTRSFIEQVSERMRGASYPAVSDRDVFAVPLPLPPLDEQRHIVARLEAVSTQVDCLRQEQASMREKLSQLRASLLDSAFRGEL